MSISLPGAAQGAPKLILRLEGAALGLGAIFFYSRLGGSWILFAVLLLLPDLTFLAYLGSLRAGAFAYNVARATLGPFALLALGGWLGSALLMYLARTCGDRQGLGLRSQISGELRRYTSRPARSMKVHHRSFMACPGATRRASLMSGLRKEGLP